MNEQDQTSALESDSASVGYAEDLAVPDGVSAEVAGGCAPERPKGPKGPKVKVRKPSSHRLPPGV